ncbi:MAG: hypothetical protein AAGJ67_16575, partial [Pseudomonadota bacterium]
KLSMLFNNYSISGGLVFCPNNATKPLLFEIIKNLLLSMKELTELLLINLSRLLAVIDGMNLHTSILIIDQWFDVINRY